MMLVIGKREKLFINFFQFIHFFQFFQVYNENINKI
jgi:hypothetical protein